MRTRVDQMLALRPGRIMYKKKRKQIEKILGIGLLGLGSLILVVVALQLILPPPAPAPLGILDGYEQILTQGSAASGTTELSSPTSLSSSMQNVGDPGDLTDEIHQTSAAIFETDPESIPSILLPESSLESERFERMTAEVNTVEGDHESVQPTQPKRISIPALGIDAPVQPVGTVQLELDERDYLQWSTPDEYAVGWHESSAPLGIPGNTVFNGHNNVHGAVFKDLADLELGERLILYDENGSYMYQITQRELFEEEGMLLKDRFWNARWMLPTSDERLTIITCWPNTTNTHRLVVIAHPIDEAGT